MKSYKHIYFTLTWAEAIQMQPLQDRIESSIVIDENGCWRWQKFINATGYGKIKYMGASPNAHRISYMAYKGKIPNGYQIDHLCRVRDCVNPEHLEAVTPKENVHRSESYAKKLSARTHCKHGHELTPENTWLEKGTKRKCKTCNRISSRNNWHKQYLLRKERRLAYAA